MKKIGILVLALIVAFLVVSCKQEINYKLKIPSWAQGKWNVSGTVTVVGEGNLTITGTYNVTSDNIYGSITYVETHTVVAVDWKTDLEGHKDIMEDFNQSSSGNEYSFTYSAKSGSDKVKQILKFIKDGSNMTYTEHCYINGLTAVTISGTLSPAN